MGTAKHTFDQAKALFERGRTDRFSLRLPECGDLATVRLWHDGKGFASDWCGRVTRLISVHTVQSHRS